ncbi:hypothetical protein CKM354_000402800 [Cercospora kikuchii]|uniref:Uncharacterized protein n=1 Tax=Cercospora kikuchii TaxID=84275 RepID=A0A9P3CHV7_9PEZI|nr:uncharacterized protein CKM354_000402800 [Cercospora kikuchii]GIZ40700.1 hypothetical protein CKM354_000402800 [Cercospora kikuchii]
MHFTQLIGISLLPITTLAVPVALSLSIVVSDDPTADIAHRRGSLTPTGHGGYGQLVSTTSLSSGQYLDYLSEYEKSVATADEALKDLKEPDEKDDDDTWDQFWDRISIADDAFKNATYAIAYAVGDMGDSPFKGKFNKEDTKIITEGLGKNFSKINETLIEPINKAVEAGIFSRWTQGYRLRLFGGSLRDLAERTALRCFYDNQGDDPDKDSDFDKATWRNIAILVDAMYSVQAFGNSLSGDRIVRAKHRLPASQWKLQL